jgi:hypothetical protein
VHQYLVVHSGAWEGRALQAGHLTAVKVSMGDVCLSPNGRVGGFRGLLKLQALSRCRETDLSVRGWVLGDRFPLPVHEFRNSHLAW